MHERRTRSVHPCCTVYATTRMSRRRAEVQARHAGDSAAVLGTVNCNTAALYLLRRAMNQLKAAGKADEVNGVGPCWDDVLDATDPDGPFTALPFGAAIQLNPGTNPPGTPPSQPPALVERMARWGFGWGGRDAYQQGALFRYRARSVARD